MPFNWLKPLWGLLAAVGLALIGRGLRGNRGQHDDHHATDTTGRAADRARERATQARERRERADDEAIRDIGNRPHTDDAVRDLEARLGGPAKRPRGDGPDEPAA